MTIPLDAAPALSGASPFGGCSVWATQDDMCNVPEERQDDAAIALDVAQELLYGLSGRQFGLCTVEGWRPPCRRQPCPLWTEGERLLWASLGSLPGVNDLFLSWDDPRILNLLPRVNRVFSVTVDGAELDPSAWRLEQHRLLIRQDGLDWPQCQDITAPLGSAGSWSLDLERGRPVPRSGQLACGVLATEIFKGMCSDKSCRLPRRTQSITRKGVEMLLTDPMDFLEKGRTGITEVDLFLTRFNPSGLRRRARVANPSTVAAQSRSRR